MADPGDIVRRGYDALAPRYGEWRAAITGSPDDEWLGDFLGKISSPADVLEVGCGQGEWAPRFLEAGHRYLGVDVSEEQLRRARDRAPGAEFRRGDIMELELELGSFDAAVAIYVFGHVPRAKLPGLLERIGVWLRPGGLLLATFGRSGWEGVEEDFLGVPMFFGSYSDEETRELLLAAGFELERVEVVPIEEPEGPATFLWVLSRKPAAEPPGRRGGSRLRRQ
ncbi:MAG TPA: class I SAM-dependent methyltransferase [Gaiellaceae bacterium]|nr:class I SAM-dependent methyltransferase [Gaiellaceae bacterium]